MKRGEECSFSSSRVLLLFLAKTRPTFQLPTCTPRRAPMSSFDELKAAGANALAAGDVALAVEKCVVVRPRTTRARRRPLSRPATWSSSTDLTFPLPPPSSIRPTIQPSRQVHRVVGARAGRHRARRGAQQPVPVQAEARGRRGRARGREFRDDRATDMGEGPVPRGRGAVPDGTSRGRGEGVRDHDEERPAELPRAVGRQSDRSKGNDGDGCRA